MADSPLLVDGHVHITNRVYWEGLDPWQPQPFGFDYARAKAAGVGVVIENVGTYGYANFNYAPKQALRLIEAFHRTLEQHADVMGLALTAADARRIAAEGRVAVFLGIEAGFDHEGDPEVLRALYRLGLRVVQFATQSCHNSFADAEIGGPPTWHGLSDHGRALVETMNELGILIDITHGTAQTQAQLIAASQAPVVASHVGLQAVSGPAPASTGLLSDELLGALAERGGMVGIHGAASVISRRYRNWLAAHPQAAARRSAPVAKLVSFVSPLSRAALDHGEYGAWLDETMRTQHLASFATPPDGDPAITAFAPSAGEWADQAMHVIRAVGPDHAGIGLDLAAAHNPSVMRNASGYPELVAALRRVTDEETARKVAGENWLRVLETVL